MLKTIVNIHEAKTQLSRLIARAEAGETIVIAKAGTPKVMLTALPRQELRTPGRFAGQITLGDDFFAALPEADLAAWEGAPVDS
jgi:prevent-host-death family protein